MSDPTLLFTELKHLGLSEKESAVYLASLELGPASVQDISHKSKVNRATTYVMIESLSGRGLMSTFTKGKKRFYAPESPDRLTSIIEHEKQALDARLGDLQRAMPMLNALYNAEGAKPQIRYLEGPEGIETVRQVFERLDGDIVEILPLDDAHDTKELMGEARVRHHKTLNQRGASFRVLAVTKETDPECFPSMGQGEWRIISPDEFPIHGSIVVRADHVFLFSYRSAIISAVVRSQEIADAVRALFDLAWKGTSGNPSKVCK